MATYQRVAALIYQLADLGKFMDNARIFHGTGVIRQLKDARCQQKNITQAACMLCACMCVIMPDKMLFRYF